MRQENIILDTDSYKASHWLQYPPKTTSVFSYIESRGGKHDKTVFFGLQYYLKQYLEGSVVDETDVEEAEAFFKVHGEPFNKEGWLHICKEHNGRLPLRIKAVAEGSVVPVSNALVTVENTCPHCFWVVSWFETMLLRVWYPITVATESRHIKRIIMRYLEATSDDPVGDISFKLHDFGGRGVSSQESAAIGGAAHLVNFMGSDTLQGVLMANRVYKSQMSAFSIPAAEHSTITSWGRENEVEAYRNMLRNFAKPGAIVAIVSDSYDIYNACSNLWGTALKQEVIDSCAVIVIRPDSGYPAVVVKNCLRLLDEKFGHTVNSKGFRVLNNVRIIQGDGIDAKSIEEILDEATDLGYSATNITFGMGGALLQQHNRDTQKFAMKCSHIVADGKQIDVYKQPVTDDGKRSKKGRLDLVKFERYDNDGKPYDCYETIQVPNAEYVHPSSALITVFEDGVVLKEHTLDEIRERAKL